MLYTPKPGYRGYKWSAEFLGVHALDLVLRQALKGSFELQKEMQVVKHYLPES